MVQNVFVFAFCIFSEFFTKYAKFKTILKTTFTKLSKMFVCVKKSKNFTE